MLVAVVGHVDNVYALKLCLICISLYHTPTAKLGWKCVKLENALHSALVELFTRNYMYICTYVCMFVCICVYIAVNMQMTTTALETQDFLQQFLHFFKYACVYMFNTKLLLLLLRPSLSVLISTYSFALVGFCYYLLLLLLVYIVYFLGRHSAVSQQSV